jgi:hypothetical protein
MTPLPRRKATVAFIASCLVATVLGADEPALRCFAPDEFLAHVMVRRVKGLRLEKAALLDAVNTLREKHGVPLSFVEADTAGTVTLALTDSSVEDVLTSIVAQAKDYRFGVVQGHLALYPKDAKYELRLEDLHVVKEPRIGAAQEVVQNLRLRAPFAHLAPPLISGVMGLGQKPPLYTDLVTLKERGTVVEALVGLAGSSPSVVISVARQETWHLSMVALGVTPQLRSLTASLSKPVLAVGETAPITVTGIDLDGKKRDLSGRECGTRYSVSDNKVLAFGADGVLTGLSPGQTSARAEFETQTASTTVEVRDLAGREKRQ